jgi:hypothetical protein
MKVLFRVVRELGVVLLLLAVLLVRRFPGRA